jgi:hypothetical protein
MKRKLRVLKAKGGADAAKDDFKTPSSMSAVTQGNPFSAGNQGATNTSSSINNTNNNTTNNTIVLVLITPIIIQRTIQQIIQHKNLEIFQ